jgi:glutamate-5-semialdehyde dehydrogenase
VLDVARGARQAANKLALLSDGIRREALLAVADALVSRQSEILNANQLDVELASEAVARGDMSRAFLDRLKTSEAGMSQMAAQVRAVAALQDPLGIVLSATQLDDDLKLYKVSCPLGVIAIVFESRPDVIPQVAALTLRSGNAVVFKGGKEAANTNAALLNTWQDALKLFSEIPPNATNLIHTRTDVAELLALEDEVDLVIPRGSKEFVRHIAKTSHIPVMGHGEGICHVYVDSAADPEKALAIALDSKIQYPAACNSMETLLVHHDIAPVFLEEIVKRFRSAGVEVRGCSETVSLAGSEAVFPASDADWSTEYSDLVVSIKVVDTMDEAIQHISRYGSRHTETIVTDDHCTAQDFMNRIDAAGVFHNASTRFADGFRYGLGAELGISTAKLHARGPVGLEGLTTYKYKLVGQGHTVEPYVRGERSFKHTPLPS